MKKAVKILVITVVLVAVAVLGIWFIREKSLPLKEEKVIFNLEWGMSVQDAKVAMARKGYTDFKVVELTYTTAVIYTITDYQNIKGANCEMMLMFEEDKLNGGTMYFRTESDSGCTTSKEMVNKLKLMFAKRYEESCIESISEEYTEDRLPEDPDYSRYFVGEESLVFVRSDPNNLYVRFEDLDAPHMKELIEALKILDETNSPSPTGYYSTRGSGY